MARHVWLTRNPKLVSIEAFKEYAVLAKKARPTLSNDEIGAIALYALERRAQWWKGTFVSTDRYWNGLPYSQDINYTWEGKIIDRMEHIRNSTIEKYTPFYLNSMFAGLVPNSGN